MSGAMPVIGWHYTPRGQTGLGSIMVVRLINARDPLLDKLYLGVTFA